MSTQPSQDFLHKNRLADLAQAVVPDDHDLWPAIERQARRAMTRPPIRRAGLLSRGRSAVWLMAGALAIAVTLGFFALGIAALLFPPDQEPAPAAQPDDALSPTPASVATLAPTPPASASETPVPTVPLGFEASLTGDDLARYRALPVEFQFALSTEAEASEPETAVELLRGLPESVPPLEDVLSANGRGLLERADERLQRALLLDGYPDAVNRSGLLNARTAREYFEEMVMDATISSRRPWYPPIDETLTSEALAKLEAVDPVIERAFRLVWEFGWNPVPVPEPGWDSPPSMTQIGLTLLAAPMTMPSIDDLGLPVENVRLFESLPALGREWIWRMIAANLTLGKNPANSEYLTFDTLAFFSEPSSKAAFEQGFQPVQGEAQANFPHLSCRNWPAGWPPGSVAIELEDLPVRPMFLPLPGEVLSETALNNLRSMDPRLRELFSREWGAWHYLSTQSNCRIARWDRQLSNIPMLIPPSALDLLSPESLSTYNGFRPGQKAVFEEVVSLSVLRGGAEGETGYDNVYFDGDLDAFMDALRDWAERWVAEFAEQNRLNPPPGVTPPATESWVSEDGFIQFTTGEAPLTEPLPGTHPWCINPSSAPDKAGPFLVPSVLPEGMAQTRRVVVMGRDVIRVFRRGSEQIPMWQTLCVTVQLKEGRYKKVPIGERTAYVIQGPANIRGAAAPAFEGPSGSEPDGGVHLVMDIGYGIVTLDSFPPRQSGITAEDLLIRIASSLVPEELTEAQKGPFPQWVLDQLGPTFGPIYVPGYLPAGYEIHGQLQESSWGTARTSELRYARGPNNGCEIYLAQAALGQGFSDIVDKAERGDESTHFREDGTGNTIVTRSEWKVEEIDGITLYAQEYTVQGVTGSTDVYFQAHEVWFYLGILPQPQCGHTLDMAAEMAASLKPLQASALDAPGTTSGDSWVSEDGFIQFTTGEEPLTEPLPGTHPWCVSPLSAPDKLGPILVPSELPGGMVQTRRDELSTQNVVHMFQGGDKRITMMQMLCMTTQLKEGYYEKVPIGDRTAYVSQGVYVPSGGSTPVFDPNGELNLVMDIGYGSILLYAFAPRQSGITVDDLVLMASSLVPEELIEAETGPSAVDTPTGDESWVSEDGFIQFTTGEEPFTEPLSGTHPWCARSSSPPNKPGPFLVPSELPEGMEQTRRSEGELSGHAIVTRVFEGGDKRVSMLQTLCMTTQLEEGFYERVQVNDRTAYVMTGEGLALVMDIGHGVIILNAFMPLQPGVTVDDLVLIASSLVPEEQLTEAETGPLQP